MHWYPLFTLLALFFGALSASAYLAYLSISVVSGRRLDSIVRLPTELKRWNQKRLKKKRDGVRTVLEQKLPSIRAELASKIENLAELENVMRCFHLGTTVEEVIRFLNESGIQHSGHFEKILFLILEDSTGLGPWIKRFVERDVVGEKWYLNNTANAGESLHHHLIQQQELWTGRRDFRRTLCMDLQRNIESYESALGIEDGRKKLASPDKRSALKKVRVDITELRLEEERIEQEILKEEGGPGEYRKKAHISSEND